MTIPDAASPNVAITYCRLCGWLLRASWMAQELLTTFAEELGSVTLIPDDTGGVFEIRVDGRLIWSRNDAGRFPEAKELKPHVVFVDADNKVLATGFDPAETFGDKALTRGDFINR